MGGIGITGLSLAAFAGSLIVAAGSPGPSIAALVSRVIAKGHRDVLPFLAAMWIGEAVWLSLAVFGLAALAQSFHLVFTVINWVGVAYLLFLAFRMWTAPVEASNVEIPKGGSGKRLFFAGLAVTLGNPKIMMFYMALLPAIVDLRAVTVPGWLALVGTMAIVLFVVDLAWVLFASGARQLLRSPKTIRMANRTSAATMAGAAAAIAGR